MTTFLEHLCSDNTRWDALAWQYYQNPYAWQAIVEANPTYRKELVLNAGVLLQIPIDNRPNRRLSDDQVPPWRRGR